MKSFCKRGGFYDKLLQDTKQSIAVKKFLSTFRLMKVKNCGQPCSDRWKFQGSSMPRPKFSGNKFEMEYTGCTGMSNNGKTVITSSLYDMGEERSEDRVIGDECNARQQKIIECQNRIEEQLENIQCLEREKLIADTLKLEDDDVHCSDHFIQSMREFEI